MKNILNDDQISELSFEEAFSQLEEIVDKLENGESSLEESINFYDFGKKLKDHCENKLKNAELKIQKVVENQELEKIENS